MQDRDVSVFAADIGSMSNNAFAWASLHQPGGRDLDGLATAVARDLKAGKAVALGFEAPMWVPISEQPATLTRARPNEGNRAWSAGAGCGALATGLVQSTWILRELRRRVPNASVHLDWSCFIKATGARLFLWEAFVSGAGKGENHDEDAAIAVRAFRDALPEPPSHSLVRPDGAVFSILGAAIVHTGWSTDTSLLATACLVFGPTRPAAATSKLPKSARRSSGAHQQ